MTLYTRLTASMQAATREDLLGSRVHLVSEDYDVGDSSVIEQNLVTATTATTVYTSHLTSVRNLLIENTSTLYPLLVRAYTILHTETFAADVIEWSGGGPPDSIILSNNGAYDLDWLTDYAFVDIPSEFVVTGAAESTNNSTWAITYFDTYYAWVRSTQTVTTDALDAGTPTIVQRAPIYFSVPAGQAAVFGAIQPAGNISVTSIGGAGTAKLSYIGAA